MRKLKSHSEKRSPWLITTFFVAAAVRKGATSLPDMLDGKTFLIFQPPDGNYWLRAQLKDEGYFTVHHDGTWNYVLKSVKLSGKLQPPHSNQWLEKMLAKGTPGEIARQDLETFKNLRKVKR